MPGNCVLRNPQWRNYGVAKRHGPVPSLGIWNIKNISLCKI